MQLSLRRIVRFTGTPEIALALQDIQSLRTTLREQALPAEREAQLGEDLTTAAIYHANRMEGNRLTFAEAQVVIDGYRGLQRPESFTR